MGAEFKALLKVSWGFARIHFGAPFGVCGTALRGAFPALKHLK